MTKTTNKIGGDTFSEWLAKEIDCIKVNPTGNRTRLAILENIKMEYERRLHD